MYRITRRDFVTTIAATTASLLLPSFPAEASAKYTRYNVTSPQGQKMLEIYSKGIQAMLNLPPDNPHNWFRNAFIHLLDCPHGNWWFYVWHRAYLGYFEQTIRTVTGESNFTLPYWDWTLTPEIPDGMFNGPLTPTDKSYMPYTESIAVFQSFIKPTLNTHWNNFSPAQRKQLVNRGYKTFDEMWHDVTGYNAAVGAGISGNEAFAPTCNARYLSRSNPKLDKKTAYDVSEFVVYAGLLPTDFYNPNNDLSFTSSKTPSHDTQPNGDTKFSVLEGLPHNIIHNCIGGVGPLDPGPYGNMTNFLSSVDPIFFLHHANIDRLWDVWTRKQQHLNLPYLPSGKELKLFSAEHFLFFVDGRGKYVTGKAGDYLSTDVFHYDYEPGFGEHIVKPTNQSLAMNKISDENSHSLRSHEGTIVVPRVMVERHLATTYPRPLVAEITLPRPSVLSSGREFDVLINAPAEVSQVTTDSPYYGGTIAFFGPNMPNMKMSKYATFAVPLPQKLQAFSAMGTAKSVKLHIRVTPSRQDSRPAPNLKSLIIRAM